jgi:hypothetical protein
MQGGLNGTADEAENARWMTYAELAEARRITPSSAIKLVVRRGWRRQNDNHGVMRALVPLEWAEPAPGRNGAHLDALQATIAELREQADAAERATQVERERADKAEISRRAEYRRADLLRERIDMLRYELAVVTAELEMARHEVQEALQSAEALRQADERWRSLGRIARMREAWRSTASD